MKMGTNFTIKHIMLKILLNSNNNISLFGTVLIKFNLLIIMLAAWYQTVEIKLETA